MLARVLRTWSYDPGTSRARLDKLFPAVCRPRKISNASRKRENRPSLKRDFQVHPHRAPNQDGDGKTVVDWPGHRARMESPFFEATAAIRWNPLFSNESPESTELETE